MATLENGNFYFFLREPGPFGLGHMGWGFQFSSSRWLFGSVENQGGSFHVGGNGDNDYWWAWGDSEAQMLQEMKHMDTAERLTNREHHAAYTWYKKIPVRAAKPNDAEDAALGQSGYFAAFNNCLDNAVHVADAYGVRAWSWARHLPSLINVNIAPKGFFFSTLHEFTHQPV
jgi:hypothetical protein